VGGAIARGERVAANERGDRAAVVEIGERGALDAVAIKKTSNSKTVRMRPGEPGRPWRTVGL